MSSNRTTGAESEGKGVATPASSEALAEALTLSEEILRNIELNEIPLANVALKASRLARLLNHFEMQQTLQYEVSGYPSKDGVPPDVWRLGVMAGRLYHEKDKEGNLKEFIFLSSIAALETMISSNEIALGAAVDPNVSVSSANPMQYVLPPTGNRLERLGIRSRIDLAAGRLASRRDFIYRYVSTTHYELKFSGIASDIFSRIRERVDSSITHFVPDAVQKLAAAHEGLRSLNPENWANAVHSCRRILQDLADSLFPASNVTRAVKTGGKTVDVKLGSGNYINRLIAFIEDSSASERFTEIVGSELHFIGDRIDAVFRASQKGSHANVSRDEADRYVIYTYLLVGDILSLVKR